MGKVVKHHNKLVVVYIGGNVRTQYGSRVNGQWVNDLTEERPKLPIMIKSKDQSGCSGEGYGPEEDCGDHGSRSECACAKRCQCQNPYHVYRNNRNYHPKLPHGGPGDVEFILGGGSEKQIKFNPEVLETKVIRRG